MAKSYLIEYAVEAGAEAAEARRLVGLLRGAALVGGRHDPDLFDAAILAHRRAERQATVALAAWAKSRRAVTPPRRAGQLPEQWAA